MKYKLELPLPPSINSVYVYNRYTHQKVYKKSGTSYLTLATALVQQFVKKHKLTPFTDFFYLDMYWWLPNRRLDSHNLLKLSLDVLEHGGLVENDKWILNRTQKVEYDKVNPRVLMEFERN